MDPVILMRSSLAEEAETLVAHRKFTVCASRMEVPEKSLVIGRYSVLPYYNELVADLAVHGSVLINSPEQHNYIADLKEWYQDLKDVTPRTFFSLQEYKTAVELFRKESYERAAGRFKGPDSEEGFPTWKSVVLKGKTNSLKQKWNTHMFAENSDHVSDIYKRISQDSLVGEQPIYVREFIPFRTYDSIYSVSGQAISDEYRFFVLDGKILSAGFYWSEHEELIAEMYYSNAAKVPVPASAIRFVEEEVIPKIKDKARFVVVDVARHVLLGQSKWWVIELNDGQMSGLSGCDPEELYSRMAAALGLRGCYLSGPYR